MTECIREYPIISHLEWWPAIQRKVLHAGTVHFLHIYRLLPAAVAIRSEGFCSNRNWCQNFFFNFWCTINQHQVKQQSCFLAHRVHDNDATWRTIWSVEAAFDWSVNRSSNHSINHLSHFQSTTTHFWRDGKSNTPAVDTIDRWENWLIIEDFGRSNNRKLRRCWDSATCWPLDAD